MTTYWQSEIARARTTRISAEDARRGLQLQREIEQRNTDPLPAVRIVAPWRMRRKQAARLFLLRVLNWLLPPEPPTITEMRAYARDQYAREQEAYKQTLYPLQQNTEPMKIVPNPRGAYFLAHCRRVRGAPRLVPLTNPRGTYFLANRPMVTPPPMPHLQDTPPPMHAIVWIRPEERGEYCLFDEFSPVLPIS